VEVTLAPGIGVPRHTHTREDESYYVTAGELEVIVGDQKFVLKEGDALMARETFLTSYGTPAVPRITISSYSRHLDSGIL
jgi:hypothetical protein